MSESNDSPFLNKLNIAVFYFTISYGIQGMMVLPQTNIDDSLTKKQGTTR